MTALLVIALLLALGISLSVFYKQFTHIEHPFGRRTPGRAARLIIVFGLPHNKGATMSVTINSDSPGVAATLNVSDKEGVTAKVYGVPVWTTSDATIATVTPAADGLAALVKPVAEGTATIGVSLEGDPTVGVNTITGTATITVVAPEASQVAIQFGTPQ